MSENKKTETQAQPANEHVEGGGAAQEQGTELTVQDLATMRNIIDIASQRGAFKANEMESVGKMYNKLDTFLTNIQNNQQNQGGI